MSKPKRIIFVCLGNIVRSPLAEHLFRREAEVRGVAADYEVDSAGTSGYHVGESPDPRMRRTAAERGLHYDGSARRVRSKDLEQFDLILAMDESNLMSLRSMVASEDQVAKIRLMREFDPERGTQTNVPDPYYGGTKGFVRTYSILERSVRGLLDQIERGEL